MDQLAKLKNIPHQRKCNGCHEIFSSDVLGSDDKNKDFLCIHCNNDRYLIEEDTHEDCSVYIEFSSDANERLQAYAKEHPGELVTVELNGQSMCSMPLVSTQLNMNIAINKLEMSLEQFEQEYLDSSTD